jgi:hypothetical protein
MSNETIGSLIDRLTTVNLKTWNAQEEIYKIRKMTFEEYKQEYFASEEGAKRLWECLKKSCDLNVQRAALVDAIDEKIIEIVKAGLTGENLDDGKFIQRKFKTY